MPALAEQLHFPDDPELPNGGVDMSDAEQPLGAGSDVADSILPTTEDITQQFRKNHGEPYFQPVLPIEGLPSDRPPPLPDSVRLGGEAHVEEVRRNISDN